jgi:hypothetical protein
MRVIRTNNGTGVEEYDDLEGPSLLKKTLGLQNKHHSRMHILGSPYIQMSRKWRYIELISSPKFPSSYCTFRLLLLVHRKKIRVE